MMAGEVLNVDDDVTNAGERYFERVRLRHGIERNLRSQMIDERSSRDGHSGERKEFTAKTFDRRKNLLANLQRKRRAFEQSPKYEVEPSKTRVGHSSRVTEWQCWVEFLFHLSRSVDVCVLRRSRTETRRLINSSTVSPATPDPAHSARERAI